MIAKSPSTFRDENQPSTSYPQSGTSPGPPPYTAPSRGPARLDVQKMPPPLRHLPSFAPSPDGTPGPELSGDNPKGFMGHVKNFAPGKSPKKLLKPPPPSFLRPPASGLPYPPFPVMILVGKGTTLDRGFPYISPDTSLVPHPFALHDVNEQDWRRFLHDIRIAGSLSPLDKVVSGIAPLALPGVGIIFGFFIVKGVDSMMRRTKKGPVTQLIDQWNYVFFHPRHLHIGLSHGPPKDAKGIRDTSQGTDNNWRLIVSYRPNLPE